MPKIKITIRIVKTVVFFFLIIGSIVTLALFQKDKAFAKKVNCSSFETQKEAQKMFNSNRNKYKNLDANNDGVACESIK